MKIGTKEFPDECPKCGEKTGWINMPGARLLREGGPSYSTFSFKCFKCGTKTGIEYLYSF